MVGTRPSGARGFIGHTCGVKVQRERFLGLTGLTAGGFSGLTGPWAPRVADCRSAAMLIKLALRNWLSVSYVTQYPVPPIFSFPLEGKSREAGKGVQGRAPIGCSIAVLTANRRPVSFLFLTLGHTFVVRVHRAQKGRLLRLTGPKAGGFLSLTGPLAPRVAVAASPQI